MIKGVSKSPSIFVHNKTTNPSFEMFPPLQLFLTVMVFCGHGLIKQDGLIAIENLFFSENSAWPG